MIVMVGKVIHWELRKKLKFDPTNKWYIYNSENVMENETYKLLWDFEIQTDHLISARRPDPLKKKNFQNCGLSCPSGPQSKIKRK